jgi:hypothetical protein
MMFTREDGHQCWFTGELRVLMGGHKAESDMDIAEMSNISSFLEEICLERQEQQGVLR